MAMTPYILNLVVAMCLGALIGAERQWRQRMAGLRTNALVATGAAVFILSSIETSPDSPGRIAAQVVSGIGFLGAGVIMREGMNIRGLKIPRRHFGALRALVCYVDLDSIHLLPWRHCLFFVPIFYYGKRLNE